MMGFVEWHWSVELLAGYGVGCFDIAYSILIDKAPSRKPFYFISTNFEIFRTKIRRIISQNLNKKFLLYFQTQK